MRRIVVLFCLIVAAPLSRGAAQELPAPTGKVILTVGGNIERTNGKGVAALDREMLERLGVRTIRTSTVWTEGVKVFEGPLARDVLTFLGARGTTVEAVALNDYVVNIPASDFEKFDVVLALRMDGRELLARDKGPIWIVYPRDAFRELRDAAYDARWIWQLNRLNIR